MLVVNGALDRFLIPPNAFPAPLALTFALNSIFFLLAVASLSPIK
jgi:hypothetical protein